MSQQTSSISQVITQVDQNGNQPNLIHSVDKQGTVPAAGGAKKKGVFSSLFFCSCFSSPDEHAGDNPSVRRGQTAASGHGYPARGRSMSTPLLPNMRADDALKKRKTLVLDLDETLVHSSFKPIQNADFVIPVEIDDQVHHVYVAKRPGVDQFMKRMGDLFEVVVFTASLSKYADPVLDLLDIHKVVRFRLFREACSNHMGNYVKDLSRLGRELKSTIIVDNSPSSYIFHPENAVPIGSWFDDRSDTELLDLIPFLEAITKVDDVCAVLDDKRAEL